MRIGAQPTALGASPARSEAGGSGVPAALIGPNAIIQLANVLVDRCGRGTADALLRESTRYSLTDLPGHMIPEEEPLAFAQRVMAEYGEARGTLLLRDAGARTGDYLLANRIPRVAQCLIRVLPKCPGLSILLRAMAAHAWTFAGSGRFATLRRAGTVELSFHGCAMCRGMHGAGPVCDFYAGTFERLIRQLVSTTVRVHEVECQAHGGECCRFVVSDL